MGTCVDRLYYKQTSVRGNILEDNYHSIFAVYVLKKFKAIHSDHICYVFLFCLSYLNAYNISMNIKFCWLGLVFIYIYILVLLIDSCGLDRDLLYMKAREGELNFCFIFDVIRYMNLSSFHCTMFVH